MANRKELPREKKLKERIKELENQLIAIEYNYNVETVSNKTLREQLDKIRRNAKELDEELIIAHKTNREYERELKRKQKIIDFLIDSKL